MPEDDEDFANERNAITAKIAETKAGMAENKPISARIDAARRRLTRAQQRAKEAAAGLEKAQRVVEESDVEIACIECELHDLEAALAHAPAVPAEICTDNTVDAVSAQLQRLLNILKEDPEWTPTLCLLLRLTLHSSSRGFNMPSRKWKRQRGLQADPPRRMRGKQSQKVHPLRPRMSIRTRAVKRRAGVAGVAECEEISD